MRAGGGRIKGHSYENKIAKILSEWSKVQWKRVPMSGGWGSKDIASGDIFCTLEFDKKVPIITPISIECKATESWELVHFFKDTDSSPIGSWWQQSSDDAKKSKKIPIVIFSKNYFPNFIMLPSNILPKLTKLLKKKTLFDSCPQINCIVNKDDITVLLLSDFLSLVDFKTLLKLGNGP